MRYETLAGSIQLSGVMTVPEDALEVCECLLLMAAEAFGREEEWERRGLPLKNPSVIAEVLLPLLVATADTTQGAILQRLVLLSRGEANAQRLAQVGTTGALVAFFGTALLHASDPLHATAMELFILLAARSLTPQELRFFLRLDTKHIPHVPSARALEAQAAAGPDEALEDFLQRLQERMTRAVAVAGAAEAELHAAEQGIASTVLPDVPEEHLQALVAIAKAQDAGSVPFIELDMAAPRGYASVFVPSVAQLTRGGASAGSFRQEGAGGERKRKKREKQLPDPCALPLQSLG